MPAIAAFAVATDGSSGSISFTPIGQDSKGVWTYLSPDDSVYDARQKVTQSFRLPNQKSKVARAQVKLSMPIMDSVDPTKKSGEIFANLEVVIPKFADAATRTQFLYELKGLLYTSVVSSALVEMESMY